MGKDDSVIKKQALLAKKRAAENELANIEAKKRPAEKELADIEAKKRAAEKELADIGTELVAIDTILAKKRKFDEQKETLRHGAARGMEFVKAVAELNLQAEN